MRPFLLLYAMLFAAPAVGQTPGQTYLLNGPVPGSIVGPSNPLSVTGTITPGPGSTAAAVSSTSVETGHVLKASAGSLISLTVDNLSATAYLLVFNATSRPGDGAVTPIMCVQAPRSGQFSSPVPFATGIYAALSSATTCTTLTSGPTGFFTAQVQ